MNQFLVISIITVTLLKYILERSRILISQICRDLLAKLIKERKIKWSMTFIKFHYKAKRQTPTSNYKLLFIQL